MRICRFLCLALGLTFLALPAYSLIDMRNANFSESWQTMESPSTGFDLRIYLTYNSRALYNGIFGMGWCTDYETTLRVSVDNTLRVTDCGAGSETKFINAHDVNSKSNNSVESIMAAVRRRNRDKDESYFEGIEKQLRLDPDLRDEMAKQLHMALKIDRGVRYLAEGRADDSIVFNGHEYVRTLADGGTQTFDNDGHLIRLGDRNGNFVKINRQRNRIVNVIDNTGNSLQFHYWPNSQYVSMVTGPHGMRSSYKMKGEDLIEAIDSHGKAYHFEYNNYYNMTKATYPDGTYTEMSYNNDKDWIMSFRDRRGCLEKYAYDVNPANVDHYGSSVVKTCHGVVTNRSKFEFWYAKSQNGGRYLAQTLAVVNGHSTLTKYHELFGRPTEIKQDGQVTQFAYFSDGQLKSKSTGNIVQSYLYADSCHKLSETVARINEREPSSGRTQTKVITTKFFYDSHRCNLNIVKNSEGQYAKLTWDFMGRIKTIEDQSRKKLILTYDSRFPGKPSVITRPGLGSVRFKYNNDGSIDRLEAGKTADPLAEYQVANMFSNLMQLIQPATADITSI